MSILLELIQRVDSGESFYINFEKRTMKVGKEYLIKDGEYDSKKHLAGKMDMDSILRTITDLYHEYKYSLPSERCESQRFKYFKALPMERLDDFHLFNPIRREPAQARLEGFILCMILNGSFTWDEEKLGKWFWLSNDDPDLVILKKWIVNN